MSVVVQVRICTRLGVQLVSTDFNNKDYYANIRKAMVAGYFMQVCKPLPRMLLDPNAGTGLRHPPASQDPVRPQFLFDAFLAQQHLQP